MNTKRHLMALVAFAMRAFFSPKGFPCRLLTTKFIATTKLILKN